MPDIAVWKNYKICYLRVDKEEILIGEIIWGDRKLEGNVLRKLLTSSDDSYLSRSILKSCSKNICLEDFFESLCNKGEMQLLLKSPIWSNVCLYKQPIIKFEVFGQIISMNTDSKFPGSDIFRSALGLHDICYWYTEEHLLKLQ